MAKLKRANLFILGGLLAILVIGCGSKQEEGQTSLAGCDAIQILDDQVTQGVIDQRYWVSVSIVVANNSPYPMRDVTIGVDLSGEGIKIRTVTLTADVIDPFGSVILNRSINAIRPVTDYSMQVVSCHPPAEQFVAEQGLSFETAQRALEAGNVEAAELMIEQLYSSQPDETALNSLTEVKLAAAQKAMDSREWKTAEEKLQYVHQLVRADPRVRTAIWSGRLRRNTLFLLAGIGVVFYMVRRGWKQED